MGNRLFVKSFGIAGTIYEVFFENYMLDFWKAYELFMKFTV